MKRSAIDRDVLSVPERRLGAAPPSHPGPGRVRESIRRAPVIVVIVGEENQRYAAAGSRGTREHATDMGAVIRPRVDDHGLPAGPKHVGICSL